MSGEDHLDMRRLAVTLALLASCGSPATLGTMRSALFNSSGEAPIAEVGCNPSLVNCAGGGSGGRVMTFALVGVGVAVVSVIALFWRPGTDHDRTP